MVGHPLLEGFNALDFQAHRRCEIEVAAKELVPRVGASFTEGQVVPVLLHVLAQVLFEPGIVVVADHQSGQPVAQHPQFTMRCANLVTSQGIEGGKRGRVEGCDDQLTLLLVVDQARSKQALVCWREQAVVQ